MRLSLFFLLIPSLFFAQLDFNAFLLPDHPSLSWEEAPAWVAPYESSSPDFVDLQCHLETKEFYTHSRNQVLDIDKQAHLDIFFSPTFETIKMHQVSVRRGGKIIDTPFSKEATFIEEEGFFFYTFYSLEIGDVIEYAFTVKGKNPLLEEHFVEVIYPPNLDNFRYRFLHNKERKLFSKMEEGYFQPEERLIDGNWIESIYTASALEGRGVQISDFESWEEVSNWAQTLFAWEEGEDSFLDGLVDELGCGETDEAKILRALQFVQEKIATVESPFYLNKAAHPATTLARGYGDSKDKALLLQVLLKKLGYKADLCLVNKEDPYLAEILHPSCNAFNHVVTKLHLHEQELFLDTQTDAWENSDSDYPFLPLGKSLAYSSPKWAQEEMEVDATVNIASKHSEASLKIVSLFKEHSAEKVRTFLASIANKSLAEELRKLYVSAYGEVEILRPPKIYDDREKNEIRLHEYYLVKLPSDPSEFVYTFTTMLSFLPELIESKNQDYLRLQHPVNYRETVKIHAPYAFLNEPFTQEIENPAFQFKAEWKTDVDHALVVTHTYHTCQDHVPYEERESFGKSVAQMKENLSVIVDNVEKKTQQEFSSFWSMALKIGGKMMAACLVLFFPLARTRWKKK